MRNNLLLGLIFSLFCFKIVFAGEIVKPQIIYESNDFSKVVNETMYLLEERYLETISIFEIGKSVQGIPILAAAVGTGPKQILINGAHHARESLTTVLNLDQIDYIAKLKEENGSAAGSNIRALLEKVTIVFVPLVNPDGVNLVLNGLKPSDQDITYKWILKPNLFGSWKSNINGVDLNRNYPTKNPDKITSNLPSSDGYKGSKPFSEPETQALKALCEDRLFDGSIAYHSSGEVIFWHFNQKETTRDYSIARLISKETGYSLIGRGYPSKGNGFKDWFIETYEKPGLTIEISPYVGDRKVPIYRYDSIWQKNKNVPIIFSSQVNASVTRATPYISAIQDKETISEGEFGSSSPGETGATQGPGEDVLEREKELEEELS